MVNFFIERPIFATVLAVLMLLIGGICLFILPVSQYPQITPAQVQVTTTYTGADAQTVAETVTTPIEQQINGVKGMIYFNSDSTSNGVSTIVATFDVGYSQDIAAVDIQNRVQTAEAVLPPEVKQFGVTIKKTSTDMVCVVNLVSPDGRFDANYLDNYGQIYVLDVLRRIPGVSDVTSLGRKYAMRVWLDPDRMAAQLIPPAEVMDAIQAENRQAAIGKIGGQPAPAGLVFEYPILAKGRLSSVEEFEQIIVRRRDDGSIVRLRDVARVELDSENYDTAGWLSGKPSGSLLVYQYSDANALNIVQQVRASMDRLKKTFPPGLDYTIVYDTTKYVHENIVEVQETLYEAFLLVLLVVFVFLQGVRATIIPMMAIPVSLVATFALMAAFGFSINTLTLCGLVLAIGLVVDDAIIVVENVEKYLERGERPIRAVRAAMAEITTPIVTITLVLGAVFIPVAFIPGLTGNLYKQFALTIVFSFLFSALNSLTFSPAMARVMLRPRPHGTPASVFPRWIYAIAGYFLGWWIAARIFAPDIGPIPFFDFERWRFVRHPSSRLVPLELASIAGAVLLFLLSPIIEASIKWFFAAFNRGMRWLESSYDAFLELTAHHWWSIVIPSLALLAWTGYLLVERPKAFIPTEDQGYLIVAIQTPDGTGRGPTARIAQQVSALARKLDGVSDVVLLDGFNVLSATNQPNSATCFAVLEEWSHRKQAELRAPALARKLQAAVRAEIQGAVALVIQPPPIRGLSQTGGFEFMIEDRDGKGVGALAMVADRFLEAARKRPELAGVFTPFSARVPQLRFLLDRTKAQRLDVAVSDVFSALQAYLGGVYVNDFNLYGKVWKVYIQAEGTRRAVPADLERLYVLNRQGKKIPLNALGDVTYDLAPIDVPHYNMYNAAKITGQPAPGYSSGQAIRAMEEVAAETLSEGFSYEWTGTTFQEQRTGNLAPLIFALSIVCVFLFMAALYESWIRPLVIILTVPLAMFGAAIGLWLFDLPLDVFGQIGLVMLIGLETKNAILIVEFGVELQHKQGLGIIESAKEAARQRLRPILMTSFAFVMGVLPMARATGAGAYSRNSLGIVIAFGILVSTVLGRFVIPVYYVLGERLIRAFSRPEGEPEPEDGQDLHHGSKPKDGEVVL